jgi:sugar phosphate isomerase/epimerase
MAIDDLASAERALANGGSRAWSRRDLLRAGAGTAVGLAVAGCAPSGTRGGGAVARDSTSQRGAAPAGPRWELGLCQWAYHQKFFRGELDAFAFPARVARAHRVAGIDWVSTLMMRPGRPVTVGPGDADFYAELRQHMDGAGLRSALILVDLDGPPLGAASAGDRERFVSAALAWVEPARALGCTGIRVNAHSEFEGADAYARALDACSEGYERILTETRDSGLLVLIENHGELSSRGDWLAELLARAARRHAHSGAVADLGNWLPFRLTPELREQIGKMFAQRGGVDPAALAPLFARQGVEPYLAVRGATEIAPYTRAISAKAHQFDAAGNEPQIDYRGQLGALFAAGFRGWITAEYEGSLNPVDGSERTLALTRRTLAEIEGAAPAPAAPAPNRA